MLTARDRERFERQIAISEIGLAGQRKLKRSRVLIAGAGGLGSPVAIYLAAAGIGSMGIVDHDNVALNNLNRQILYDEEDIGKSKSESAQRKLKRLNSSTSVSVVPRALTRASVFNVVDGYDLVIDAMDNLAVRYLLNEAVIACGIPLIHGAVDGFEGRVMTILPGRSACLKCMHKEPAPAHKAVPVIGVTPGVIGAIQATEAIKYITGSGDLLSEHLLVYDGLTLTFKKFRIKRNPNCEACGHL